MEKLRVFEAFAGIGTQHMALKRLGIPVEVVGIAEIDESAIKSYTAIHGEVTNFGDISQVETASLPDFDLFTYSFPCQDISLAGNGGGLAEGAGTRSSLLWECKKVIELKKPKYLLLENVKNLVGKKHKADFDKWLKWLEDQGYSNSWKILNAEDYCVPQSRERVFVVSELGGSEFTFPEAQPLKVKLLDLLESDVAESYLLSDEWLAVKFDASKSFSILSFKANVKDGYQSAMVGDSFNYQFPSSKTRRGRVGHQKANTLLTSGEGMAVVVRGQYRVDVRKLTPLEYWRLTGISDVDYYKAVDAGVSKSQLYKQAGNAIVVNVLEAIFKQLLIK